MSFFDRIKEFNEFYKVDSNEVPTQLGEDRLFAFVDILSEEIEESYNSDFFENYDGRSEEELDIDLTALADWLGDIIVYCASEARRWGIPIKEVLEIIMDSNMSKADENGEAILDERGKIQKGPNYWRPEPKIRELLESRMQGADLSGSSPAAEESPGQG